jgi:hypothetical protein
MNAQINATKTYEKDQEGEQCRRYPFDRRFFDKAEGQVYTETIDHGSGKDVTARKTGAKDVHLRFWPRSLKSNLEDIEHSLSNADGKKKREESPPVLSDEKDYADYYGRHYYQVNAAKIGYSPQKPG